MARSKPLDDFPAEEALWAQQQNADHDDKRQNLRADALGERVDIDRSDRFADANGAGKQRAAN